MQLSGLSRKLTGAAVAIALCASPTMASAATAVPTRSISPLVALSAFGSQASAEALCGTAAATAAASAAAAAQAPGCVLPVTDAPPPPPAVAISPPPPPSDDGFGFGISPILLGLAGIAALAALILLLDDDDDDEPVSPD